MSPSSREPARLLPDSRPPRARLVRRVHDRRREFV